MERVSSVGLPLFVGKQSILADHTPLVANDQVPLTPSEILQ